MDSLLIGFVTIALIVIGAIVLNWEIHRQERKEAAAAAKAAKQVTIDQELSRAA